MDGPRAILSCGSCRQRKLKCDRKEPCSNCIARKTACAYTTHSRIRPTSVPPEVNQQLDARVRQLENLVDLMVAQKSGTNASENDSLADSNQQRSIPKVADPPLHDDIPDVRPGRMASNNNNEMAYFSSDHWTTIIDELSDIRQQLDRTNLHGDYNAIYAGQRTEPMLLSGTRPLPDMQSILADLPTRMMTDRLLYRFFHSTENALVILHIPTFEKEYQAFWLAPQSVSPQWLGLLFAMLAMGTFIFLRSGEQPPGSVYEPAQMIEMFQQRSTECLIISKYSTSPGPYTMEALLMNIQNEFLRRPDAHLGPWVCCGVAIRLAMRMGYHRDPSAYKELTPFQGEMRRRVWACMIQLDALTSYQLGLPSMIHEPQCDAKLPRNLLDEDFGPEDAVIRPGRPKDELTPVLYTICKSQLSAVFRTIFNRVSLGRTEAYDEIMTLHQRLLTAHDSISPRFKMAKVQDSVTVAAFVIYRRYSLELLFQKSLCILHRHHMMKSHHDAQYSFSRKTCVEAAMAILSHRSDILRETQYGGLLHRDRWLVTSIEQTDFILANMIICLELNFLSHRLPRGERERGRQDAGISHSQQNLIAALHESQAHLTEARHNSEECRVAHDVLAVILRKFAGESRNKHVSQQAMPNSMNHPSVGTVEAEPSMLTASSSSTYATYQKSSDATNPLQPESSWPNSNDIESFFDTTDMIDWDTWEAFVQNAPSAQ